VSVDRTSPQAEAVIDLDAYRDNVAALRASAPGAALMAVVKANAYGHGAAPIARAARDAGADWLGVATVAEALALRAAADVGPVLCWLAGPDEDLAAAVQAGVEVTASSVDQLEQIAAAGGRARTQLKVDTGLSRNGAFGPQWSRLVAAAASLQAAGRIEVTGTWSHFACADEPAHPANDRQEQVFADAIEEMRSAGLEPGLRHLANSPATLTRPSSHLDLVRVGIATYGIDPAPGLEHDVPLTAVMTLRGRLAAVKRVPAGSGVSYGHTFTTDRETTLGLVPLGYAEGVPVTGSNRLSAGFAGERIAQVGRVCMDQVVVDLGDRDARRGDVVTLFGPGHDGEPTATDWALAAGTIGYEIVTRVGGRVVRTYRGGP
jgi:alanine racemase